MDKQTRERVERVLGRRMLHDDQPPVSFPQTQTGVQEGARPSKPPTGPEIIRFEMWCSVTGRSFVVLAERHANTLLMKSNEPPAATGEAGHGPSPTALGSFSLDCHRDWPGCPHCGAREGFGGLRLAWVCARRGCGSPIHCCGNRDGRYRCACGIVEERSFVTVPAVPVHGASSPSSTLGARTQRASTTPALAPASKGALPPPSPRLPFRR